MELTLPGPAQPLHKDTDAKIVTSPQNAHNPSRSSKRKVLELSKLK